MKIDLHCHSKHSKRATLWVMQKLGCPESFTEPMALYEAARAKGMDAVTITDHNVIDGCLEIAGLPDTFISCEYTTYFPEDRCKVHVLVYGLREAQHEELSAARENIFDFAACVQRHGLQHVCAHPLYGPNDRLTVEHVEKLVLLFRNWEVNGDQNPEMNTAIRLLTEHLGPPEIERLAQKHAILPAGPDIWRKHLVAGSDDHSSFNLARSYTEVPGADTLEAFWAGVNEGRALVHCRPATPEMFARNVYSIAYQFYKSRFKFERYVNRDVFLRFLDRVLTSGGGPPQRIFSFYRLIPRALLRRENGKNGNSGESLFAWARYEAEQLLHENPHLLEMDRDSGFDPDEEWLEFVTQLSNKVLMHLGGHLLERFRSARLFDLFHSAGSAGALYFLLAPYFVAYAEHRKERAFSREVIGHFLGGNAADRAMKRPHKVAHFTDTLWDVNGVARTIQQQAATARRLGKDYTVLTCDKEKRPKVPGVRCFEPVGQFALPEYAELSLLAPSFLRILKHCYEQEYTHIHVSTPGPVGLAALGVARILNLPIAGTYHTALPEYGKILTEDSHVEDFLWRGMLWFYEQLDAVYAPSRATAEDLRARGLSAGKIRVYPRGVDTERFHPAKAAHCRRCDFGLHESAVKLLYVGRVSREKNLHRLAQAWQRLRSEQHDVQLIIVGDGPYRQEMQRVLKGQNAVFTGYLRGDDLPALYAACDLLVFPSATDTFGNVVLEAQASGLPVIVTDKGGPQENLLPGETGFIVPAGDGNALLQAMDTLVSDGALREAMGRRAHAYMRGRSFQAAFEHLWDMYTSDENRLAAGPDIAPFLSALVEGRALAS